jgi:hypothetical protein
MVMKKFTSNLLDLPSTDLPPMDLAPMDLISREG